MFNFILSESHHDVVGDVDWIVQRTLAIQHPLLASSAQTFLNSNTNIHQFLDAKYEDKVIGSASRLQQTLPPSVSITPVFKRKSLDVTEEDDSKKPKDENSINHKNGITIFNETSITPKEGSPPWSLGCLYKCQICRVKFQTLSSFQSHLFFHNLSMGEYTCIYGEAGVSVQHHTCHVCGHVIQQDPLPLASHMLTHGLSLASYTDLHLAGNSNVTDTAEIVSTVSSTSKSSPYTGENVRKSMDNISEGSNISQPQEPEVNGRIKGVELLEPDEVSEGVEDEDSSVEELMHMPEPDIEIQEDEDLEDFPNFHEPDVNIVENFAGPSQSFLDTLRFLQSQSQVPPPQMMVSSGPGEMFRSSDWADRCVYQCRMCLPPEVFDTHSKMSYHVKKRHNMAMKDYTTQFGRAMIHEEKHSCQICGSHVLWERSSIYQHIYQVHNKVSMEAYGKLMVNYKHGDNPGNPGSKQAGANRQGGNTGAEGTVDWTNECVFECKLCTPGRRFNSKVTVCPIINEKKLDYSILQNKISFHIKRSHGLKMTEYNAMYGTSLVSRS